MKTIPVVVNFDQSQVIGQLTVDVSKLPERPGYVFSLGYVANDAKLTEDGEIDVGKHELVCVSLMTDEQYLDYLTKPRKTPTSP